MLGSVAAAEPVSRARVADRTGLTRGTVSSLVDELIAARLLTELAVAGAARAARPTRCSSTGPGRPGSVWRSASTTSASASSISRARCGPGGSCRRRTATPIPTVVLDALAELAATVRSPRPGCRSSVRAWRVPGLVGDRAIVRLPNLPRWADVDAAGAVADRLGVRDG